MELNFNDAQQVVGFLSPIAARIETQINERKWPSFDYASLVPVNYDGDMWDVGTTFFSGDIAGQAEFVSAKGFDIPYANKALTQHNHGFELMAIGYEWTLGEVKRAAKYGRDPSADGAFAARKVAEITCYNLAMTGSHKPGQASEKGWQGLVNSSIVPTINAANGSLNDNTADQTVDEVNAALMAVLAATNDAHVPNTVLLPSSARGVLAKRLGDTGETILSYLSKNNVLAEQTGAPVAFKFSRELETAGAGGVRRMVAYERDPDVVKFHLPGDHEFLAPFQKSSMTYEVAGIMNVGGLEIRRPKAFIYVDGI